MITQALESMRAECEKLSESFSLVSTTIPTLEGSDGSSLTINLDTPIPGTFGTMRECNNRISTMLGLANGISELKAADFGLVPKSIVTALPVSLSVINDQLSGMLLRIEQVQSDGGLRDVGVDLIIHSVNQQAHPNVDLKSYYPTTDNHVDQALKGIHEILSVINPKSYDAFSGAMAGINAVQEKLEGIQKVIAALRKDAKTKTTQIETQATSTTEDLFELQNQCQGVLTEVIAMQAITVENSTDAAEGWKKISDLLSDIEETKNQANTLKGQVDSFQPTFEEFQKGLNERNETFVSGSTEFNELIAVMRDASEQNNKFIRESKDALGWNTAKGLAQSFAQSAEELVMPLKFSLMGFYLAIALLFISAAVAFNGIPPLHPYFNVPSFQSFNVGVDASLSAGSIAAGIEARSETGLSMAIALMTVLSVKVAVLFPALLLVGFTSRRHKALFHQHQLYTYKKTVASALPGFKDHAATHQEAMAAAAFARLLFNPQEDASRDLTRDAGGQWWLSKWLERVISKGVRSVMNSDGKSKGGD